MTKKKHYAGLMSLLIVNLAFAMPDKPKRCPSVAAIIANGFNDVLKQRSESTYSCVNTQTYHTDNRWVFLVSGIAANTREGALTKCHRIIKDLRGVPSPRAVTSLQVWACDYYLQGHLSLALTPVYV